MSSRKRLKRTANENSIVPTGPSDQSQSSSAAESTKSGKDGRLMTDVISSESQIVEAAQERARPTPSSEKAWSVGTWPRISKSIPSTKVATESIMATVGKQSKSNKSRLLSEYSQPSDASSNSKASSLKNESSSATGKAPEISSVSDKTDPTKDSTPILENTNTPTVEITGALKSDGTDAPDTVNPQSKGNKTDQKLSPHYKNASESSTWLEWFSSKPESIITQSPDTKPTAEALPPVVNVAGNGNVGQEDTPSKDLVKSDNDSIHTPQQPKAWLGFWNSTNTTPRPITPVSVGRPAQGVETQSQPQSIAENNQVDLEVGEAPSDSQGTVSPTGVRTSGWAFWSRDVAISSKATSAKKDGKDFSVSPSRKENAVLAQAAPLTPSKRARPISLDTNDVKSTIPQDLNAASAARPKDGNLVQASTDSAQSTVDTRKAAPNLLLPSLKNTYHLLDNASILEQLARLLHLGKPYPIKHVSLVREPVRIKKALAIGVHGYFPAPLLRTVLGQPTGTSIRFASSAAEAIERFTANQGYTCEIEKVALEGEGRISERIETLWKLMLNWIDHIKNADFIMVACHSQGVPVAMMLIAKLIEFGCVSSARIGVCAMAGVNLGPFPDYKSRLFSSGSAGELFEFSNPKSLVSQRYEDALKVALHHGVRIVYIGSIDDQLVSLESSTFSTVSHPYIYRAVFIDGRVHAPDFISHLVGFALKLRNLGISDHGLIRELSSPLAGSLYTGEGHSRIYNDGAVYDLAIDYALLTTSIGDLPLQVMERQSSANANPYILPWAMRGLLEEAHVKTELGKETQELLEQFDLWNPTSKVLKDVKFRLEAVKSKL